MTILYLPGRVRDRRGPWAACEEARKRTRAHLRRRVWRDARWLRMSIACLLVGIVMLAAWFGGGR